MRAIRAQSDVVVDLREGSATFGRWDSVLIDDVHRRAVYVPEGLGHALLSLDDVTTVAYLCSAPYAPGREHAVHPLDPELGIQWPAGIEPLLSDKDRQAPTLAEAREQGLLPSYQDCLDFYDSLRGPAA